MKYRATALLAAAVGLLALLTCQPRETTPPELVILYPGDGETLYRGVVTVKVLAADSSGVNRVDFHVDGELETSVYTSIADTFHYDWNATDESAGTSHVIRARAYDAAGNSSVDSVSIRLRRTGGGGGSGPTYHRGAIDRDETWYAAENPHVIEADVYPTSGHTITIQPGCWVQFANRTELRCGYGSNAGALVAVGTPDSIIFFTSNVEVPAAGDWDNIGIYSGALPTTQFSYCRFEYGGRIDGENGMILVDNTGARFDHCTIQYSGDDGVVCRNGGYFVRFDDNIVRGCRGYPLRIDCDRVGTIGNGNILSGNTHDGVEVLDGIIATGDTWPDLRVPYVLTGDISVGGGDNPVLTLLPGVRVEVAADAELRCGDGSRPGGIVAVGTPDSGITFTSSLALPAPGVWDGIGVYDEALSVTEFRYCTIEYAGQTNSTHGALYVDNAGVRVNHCTIRFSDDYGVACHDDGWFREFGYNTVSDCSQYPVRIGCARVGSIGAGNTFAGNALDGVLVLGGTIASSVTWANVGVPYVLDDDVSVGGGNTPVLTIAPGTTVKLRSRVELRCGFSSDAGAIVADGTDGRITFTSGADAPAQGDWRSISFYGAASPISKLVNCRLEYGGYGSSTEYGNIYIAGSEPTVYGDSIGHSSGYGIYVTGSPVPDTALLHSQNTFYDNRRGAVGP